MEFREKNPSFSLFIPCDKSHENLVWVEVKNPSQDNTAGWKVNVTSTAFSLTLKKKNFTILSSFSTVIVRATEKETGQKRQKTFSFCHTIYELLSFSPFSPTHRENGWTWRLFFNSNATFLSLCVFITNSES